MTDRVPLRSATWLEAEGKQGFIHRAWLRGLGLPDDSFRGRPIIGVANSASELAPCNAGLGQTAEAVKRGVWQAGGIPLEFPTMSLGETLMRPTTMMFRNLMAMEVEELLRANPLDGVVLLSGCDKTTPAMLMAAASVDIPAIVLTAGPMLAGNVAGRRVGCGTDVWRWDADVQAGRMSADEFRSAESGMVRSQGFCQVMGTASTMASLTEVIGMQPSGFSSLAAPDSRRLALAHEAGRRITAMVLEGLRPSKIVTQGSLRNAVVANAALGGSTNAVLHLLAIAGRFGLPFDLRDFDDWSRDVPLLVDVKPSGDGLMDDFDAAGGIPALLAEVADLLSLEELTLTGRTIGEEIAGARSLNTRIIRTRTDPIAVGVGTAVLHGSLAPGGAVIKQSAASRHLLVHTGRAVVFRNMDDYVRRINDLELPIDADSVIVVQNVGPVGYPGMPEVGNFTLPRRLLEQGIDDVIRISDARMSGTGFGTVVLHVAPEAAVGGPLALVRDGDQICLDVPERRLDLLVSEAELEVRRRDTVAPLPAPRGYRRLYTSHVLQADKGVDFDFLVGGSGDDVAGRSV